MAIDYVFLFFCLVDLRFRFLCLSIWIYVDLDAQALGQALRSDKERCTAYTIIQNLNPLQRETPGVPSFETWALGISVGQRVPARTDYLY